MDRPLPVQMQADLEAFSEDMNIIETRDKHI